LGLGILFRGGGTGLFPYLPTKWKEVVSATVRLVLVVLIIQSDNVQGFATEVK
jgi:galactokinase/mevalonate kinase-like predicted kinase